MRIGSLQLLGRLDRYVARLFFESYATAFILVVGLFLILDMAGNLDDYLAPEADGTAPAVVEVLRFYLLQMPFLYLSVAPFVTLVAGLFTAARLARSNEIVAALSAGVSAPRLLLPVFMGGTLFAAGMFALREWATDALGRQRDALHDRLTERRPAPIVENLWVPAEQGRQVRLRSYTTFDPQSGGPQARGLSCRFREGARSTTIQADLAVPLASGAWKLSGGRRLSVEGEAQQSERIDELYEVRFSPADVELAWKAREAPLELSFSQCRELVARDPSNIRIAAVLQYHITFPLAGLVLLLVGLPFFAFAERGRPFERVALGFLLCLFYFGVDFALRTLGLQGEVGPLTSGWGPILLFGSLGAVLFGSMRT
jgi:lipopolysaccharide export LptBFGC system permease protein LptF